MSNSRKSVYFQVSNRQGAWNSRWEEGGEVRLEKISEGGRGLRKGKILIGEGWLYVAFFFPFLTIKNTIFRTFVYTVTLKKNKINK